MQPIYTFNDTSIEIQIIEKDCYYKANIPNNEANKMLIENTIFKFEKSGSVIIMHDDVHVFQLYKLECNYSDYIEMKEQLEHLKNENNILKKELSNNNNLLQHQIKETDNLKNELNDIKNLLQQQIKISKDKHKKEIDNLKNDMEQLKNENNILKKELSNNNNLLQHQIKETDNLKNELNDIKNLLQI